MPIVECFATRLYRARLARRTAASAALNRALLAEVRQLERDDAAGQRWSARHYPGGYTSYASAHRLQRLSPTFAALEQRLTPHVRAFARAARWDLSGRELAMTDCWANVMRRGAAHPSHLHPLATLSGTYYIAVPPGTPGIKFEDPRLERFMARPPLRAGAGSRERPWLSLAVRAGELVLFESWLRHEVPALTVARERVSVSFNYAWF
jgi:uncharacterized protein (TIGR02466 family)